MRVLGVCSNEPLREPYEDTDDSSSSTWMLVTGLCASSVTALLPAFGAEEKERKSRERRHDCEPAFGVKVTVNADA